MKATQKQWELTKEQLNPQGSNFKDVKYINVTDINDKGFSAEVGYWITYIGCRPKYTKENVFISIKR